MGNALETTWEVIRKVVIDPALGTLLFTVKVVHEGTVYIIDIANGRDDCLVHCGNFKYSAYSCKNPNDIAMCGCDKCGMPLPGFCLTEKEWKKLAKSHQRRRLQQETSPSLPYFDECTQNEKCRNMMLHYRYDGLDPSDIQSPEDRCAQLDYECTDQELDLFQNVVDEISVNFPTSPEEMCSGFYEYLDDGTPRTFDQAEAVCEDDFLSDLVRIQTEQQFDCAISTIGDGSSPWIRYDDYNLVQNRHHSHRMYGYEHISCDQPQTAVLCYSSICLPN